MNEAAPVSLRRRRLILAGAGLVLAGGAALPQSSLATLKVATRTLQVFGKAAKVSVIEGASTLGLVEGGRFAVRLENELGEPTILHWHGLTPPSVYDGSHLSQGLVKHGGKFEYDFVINRSGTHWMHSHVGLQGQGLLAAPLIVRSVADIDIGEQEHVIMLHDFTFRDPQEILADLKAGRGGHGQHAGHSSPDGAMPNDVAFDAFLANDRTLDDPEVVRVDPASRVRLRIINAAAASNMLIDLGSLNGELVAIDGDPVEPVTGNAFGIAIAQRADIKVMMPPGRGAYPVLARPEGQTARAGIVLATEKAAIEQIPIDGDMTAAILDVALEARLRARSGLSKKNADRIVTIDLGGGGSDYVWNINGKTDPHAELARVGVGERVEFVLRNQTTMAHPMHLHGHHFQIVGVGATRIDGAMRDTVLVPANGQVTIAFNADNPGLWAFHCHHLYHQNSGMMGAIAYER